MNLWLIVVASWFLVPLLGAATQPADRPKTIDGMLVYPFETNLPIRGADFSPDSRHLAIQVWRPVESDQGRGFSVEVQVWDFRERKLVGQKVLYLRKRAGARRGEGVDVRYSGDGQTLVVAAGWMLHVLQSDTLEEIRRIGLDLPFASQRPVIVRLEIAQNIPYAAVLISLRGFRGGEVRVYSLETGELVRQWKFEDVRLQRADIAWHPDGRKLAVTLLRNIAGARVPKNLPNLVVLDLESGKRITQIKTRHTAGPVCFTPDNKVLTATLDPAGIFIRRHKIKVWDATSGRHLYDIDGGPTGVRDSLELSADGRILLGYVGKEKTFWNWREFEWRYKVINQKFRLWDLTTGEVIATSPEILPIIFHELRNIKMRLSPRGDLVLVHFPSRPRLSRIYEIPLTHSRDARRTGKIR